MGKHFEPGRARPVTAEREQAVESGTGWLEPEAYALLSEGEKQALSVRRRVAQGKTIAFGRAAAEERRGKTGAGGLRRLILVLALGLLAGAAYVAIGLPLPDPQLVLSGR